MILPSSEAREKQMNLLTDFLKTTSASGCGIGGINSFDERTDTWSASQYFQFYSYLSQQQNMLQVRASLQLSDSYVFLKTIELQLVRAKILPRQFSM